MQTKITCFDKVREDLRRTLKFVGDVGFMIFSVVCSLRPPKIEDVGIHDMFCFEAELYVKISEILTPPTPGFVKNM